MDSLDINEKLATEMVDEANVAFRLNMELFQELDSMAGFTATQDEIHKEISHQHHDMTGVPPPECPFSAMLAGKPVSSSVAPNKNSEIVEKSKVEQPPKEDITVQRDTIPGIEEGKTSSHLTRIILISLLCFCLSLLVKQLT